MAIIFMCPLLSRASKFSPYMLKSYRWIIGYVYTNKPFLFYSNFVLGSKSIFLVMFLDCRRQRDRRILKPKTFSVV